MLNLCLYHPTIQLALVRFTLKVSLCENHQKQKKEAPSYSELETLPLGQLTVVKFTDRFSVVAFLSNKIALAIILLASYRAGLLLVAYMKYSLSHPWGVVKSPTMGVGT